jgi:predicted Zn finger-like uncharacterized protein
MKIVCGSCQAKYSIADEKVAGKVFKIRCKRCSEVIVVRGDQEEAGAGPAPAAAAAPEETAAPDAIWHVVVNGEQAGPYGPAQLSQMLSSGQLDWEAYVWTEGFENWLPMRDVPELVSAISGPNPREAAEQPVPVRAAAQQPLAAAVGGYPAQPSMGADPFADDSATTAGVFASSMAQPAPRSNLFVAGNADSPFEASEARAMSPAAGPRVTMEQAMTGARNENSVLFSLKNLQALATGSTAPSGPAAPSIRPGFAAGEGSGLIDIRALATATGVNDQGRNASEKDALLSLGSAQAGAFGALGSPMLAPGRVEEEGSKKGLVFAIVGGFALLAVAGIAAAVILKPAQTEPSVVGPVVPPPVAAAPMQPAPPPTAVPVEPPSEGELSAQKKLQEQQAAAAPAAPSEGAHGSRPGAGGTKRPNERAERPAEPAAKVEPAAPKVEDKPKPKGGSSSIDDLLDSAIGGSGKPRGASSAGAAESTANLPDKPSREDVLSAMNGVKAGVSACAKGAPGVAFANVTVAGKTGRVSNVEVTGMTGEIGSCIARTVRGAKFPRFKSDSFQVKFPFRL